VSTRRTIQTWIERFNLGDAAGISALYAEDAVNHQIPLTPVVGRSAIEQFHTETFAGGPLTCVPINLCATAGSSTNADIGTARSSTRFIPVSTVGEPLKRRILPTSARSRAG
jgi:hypothetical protein